MLTQAQLYCLNQMGITLWSERSASSMNTVNQAWESLRARAKSCQACSLHCNRKNVVFGCGSLTPSLLIIGEAPGQNEDQQGEPFVGRAGQLLNRMLQSIGFRREEVYITNVIKCRPPNNRDPLPSEVASCTPFLDQQVSLLKPKLMLAVGRIAAHYLLQTDQSLAKMRNVTHVFRKTDIPLIVTYHPAYLLRNPIDKRKAYEDLMMVKDLLSKSKLSR